MSDDRHDPTLDSAPPPPFIQFGREICGDLAAAEAREWLVTNGLGGFACGTVAGTLTRRYHGLLIAALPSPWNRTLLVSKIDEVVEYDGQRYSLGANRWGDGAIDPCGYRLIESFRLEGTTPVWTFACADALLEKRIWMKHGENTTSVQYKVVRSSRALRVIANVLVNWRGFHCLTHVGEANLDVQPVDAGLRIQPEAGAPPYYLLSGDSNVEPARVWYRNYELAAERLRGLDHHEDHLLAGVFQSEMKAGESVVLMATTNPEASSAWMKGKSQLFTENPIESQCRQRHFRVANPPAWIAQLALAADQFIIARPGVGQNAGASVIAGYPWFGEWGRDTMIALPGLLLATGRAEIAAQVLRTYAGYVDKGMLPNQLPGPGELPEYNTVDAALWFIDAARQHFAATGDLSLIREILPALAQIIDAYTHGTRYNIHLDPADGLIYAGEPGVQLTWMDAKIVDWVVTPRLGKPVEVNALWLNALATMVKFADVVGTSSAPYAELASQARQGFRRFWNPAANYCFDVLDSPQGNDDSLRPNQIFAVALDESAITPEQQRAVVDVCARELLTSFGLRSLAPRALQYQGQYGGDQRQRDGAYHQGTVWGWLMGPFIHAILRVTGDKRQALTYLAPFENHLKIHGLGTASEIFNGDPPFAPHGCFAQAWTVAELLRAWAAIGEAETGQPIQN